MNEIETWKDIPGYEGLYQVSDFGRVKSLAGGKTKREKILKQMKNTGGYLFVIFSNKGIRKHFLVNRLIAFVFHGLDINNPKELSCHKDDNIENNRADNIFVGNQKDNMIDMTKKGRNKISIGMRNGNVKLTEDQVREIRISFKGNFGEKSKLSKKYGVSSTTISSILKRKLWNLTI